MQSDINDDVTAISIQLNELRSKFDLAMREEHDIMELRETYQQMKELECHIKALHWCPENHMSSHTSSYSRWA